MTCPVVEFKPNGSNRVNEIDAGDLRLKSCRCSVLLIPGKKVLDRTGEQIVTDIAEDLLADRGGTH